MFWFQTRVVLTMWQAISFLIFMAAVALHLWWRRRFNNLKSQTGRLKEELAEQKEQHLLSAANTEAQQQALFNSMLEGVLLLDEHGRIRLVNEALKMLFAVSNDILGMTIIEAFRIHELANLVGVVSSRGQVLGFELELSGVNKRSLQVNAAAVFDQEKHLQGTIFVFHDLTRLRQLENTRREFVANVSHELRTPLSLIKGFVETLIDGAKDDPNVAGPFLQKISKHTDRLAYLIEDLLTISQLESGKSMLNFQPVELKPIAQRVIEDLNARAAEKHVTLVDQVPTGLQFQADGNRLQQVFFNLIDNAIKYGRKDGHVFIAARQIKDNKIEVSVKDDGPGIPPEATERVFERFFRVDRARSREQGGTGLGLSIVKHIVQSHGGEVWAESEPSRGATFYFTLPQSAGDE